MKRKNSTSTGNQGILSFASIKSFDRLKRKAACRCGNPKGRQVGWGESVAAIASICCLLLVQAAGYGIETNQDSSSRPNVVVLVADDLGYGELGCQGNSEIPTPAIDSIARRGIRFTQGYVSASYCSPSRAGFFSGRYQTRFGHELNPVGDHNLEPKAGMPPEIETIAERFQRAGYSTGLFGKWHLGAAPECHPLEQGFDEFYGFLHEGHYFVPPPYKGQLSFLRRKELPNGERGRQRDGNVILSTHLPYDEPDYDRNNPILRGKSEIVEPVYFTDALTREARDFVGRHKDSPFFMCLSYSAVHSPMQAPLETLEKYENIQDEHRRVFAGMVHHLDKSVGEILDQLEQLELLDNTIVLFFSDNGGPTRELTSSNQPLRGEKGSMYEGGIRVPMMVQWPRRWNQPQEYHAPVIALDWATTLASAAGLKNETTPSEEPNDGVDLLPFLDGESAESPHDVLYWRMGRKAAIRLGDWKAVATSPRLVVDCKEGELKWELYDLSVDLREAEDVAAQEPEILEALVQRFHEESESMVAPAWRPRKR